MVKTFFFFLMGGSNSQKWQVVASSYTFRTSIIFELMLYSNRDQFWVLCFYGSNNFLTHLLILNYIKLLLQTIRGKEKYVIQCKKKNNWHIYCYKIMNQYISPSRNTNTNLLGNKKECSLSWHTYLSVAVLKPEVSLKCRFWLCSPEVGPKLLHLLQKGQRKTQVIGPQTMLWRQRSKALLPTVRTAGLHGPLKSLFLCEFAQSLPKFLGKREQTFEYIFMNIIYNNSQITMVFTVSFTVD